MLKNKNVSLEISYKCMDVAYVKLSVLNVVLL